MDLIAHRGFAARHPGNTLRAVRAAVRRADWVEIDVRRCRTGEPVVVHDATLDRVTDATGPVAERDPEELAALSVLGSDEGVPTLAAVLETIAATEAGINVELKEPVWAALDRLRASEVSRERVLVSSFDADTLQAVAERSSVPLALLFANGPDAALDTATSLGCAAVHPYRRCCDAGFINTAHGAGFDVNAWTVKTETQADRLAALDVDGLIVDAPACCRS